MQVPGDRSEVTADESSVPMAPEFHVKHEAADMRAYDEEVLGAYQETPVMPKSEKPGAQIPEPLLAYIDDPLKFIVLRMFSLSFTSLTVNDIEAIVKNPRYLSMAKFVKDLFPNGLSYRIYDNASESTRDAIGVQIFLASVAHQIPDLLEDTKTPKQYEDTIEAIKHVWHGTLNKLDNNKEKNRVLGNRFLSRDKTRVAKNASRITANIKALIEQNKHPDNTHSELGELLDTINPIPPYFSFENRHEDRFAIKVRYSSSDPKKDDDNDDDDASTKKRSADNDDQPVAKRAQESGRVTVQVAEDKFGCTVVIRVNNDTILTT